MSAEQTNAQIPNNKQRTHAIKNNVNPPVNRRLQQVSQQPTVPMFVIKTITVPHNFGQQWFVTTNATFKQPINNNQRPNPNAETYFNKNAKVQTKRITQ
jgi:hypothetical protein